MKPKANPDRYNLVPPPMYDDPVAALRVVDHIQSGLRQLCFGFSAFVPTEQRTPELDSYLAALHEDEARYHTREAAWLTGQTYEPDNGGRGRATRSRTGSSQSRSRKVRPSSSVVLVPYEESSK